MENTTVNKPNTAPHPTRSWWSVAHYLTFGTALIVISLFVVNIFLFWFTFIAGILLLARGSVLVYNSRYEVNEEEVTVISGILSPWKKVHHIPYANVYGVDIQRSLFDRLVGTGDILIGNDASRKVEMILDGIRYPEYWLERIEKKVDAARAEGGALLHAVTAD